MTIIVDQCEEKAATEAVMKIKRGIYVQPLQKNPRKECVLEL